MTELRIQLQPKQKLCAEMMLETPEILFGGAKGGGKSGGMRRIFLSRRFKFPGSTAGIFRKTFPELESNHIQPLFREYPALRPYYNESKKLLSLPNGSSIAFRFAANVNDLDKQQGAEYDDLGIDEVGQWTEEMYTKLRGSARSSKPGIKPRILLTGNPGGIGHSWLKRIFIQRKFTDRERPEDYGFIQALVQDNQALMLNDPDYVHRLNAEKNEALRRAYLFGDWDIIAGAYFGELRKEIHVCTPFDIPKHWKKFGAYDYGYGHPAAFGWFACDEDGNVYMYRELVQAKTRVDQFAAKVKELEDPNNLEYIVAGLDCWVEKNSGLTLKNVAPTIAEEFMNHGISLSKASIGRIQGAVQMRNYLAWEDLPDGREQPRFKMFSTCPVTFDCLTRMEHDPDRIEDVLKVDAVEGDPLTGDDSYDMARYALMSRPPLTERPKPRHRPGTEAWGRQEAKDMEEMLVQQHQNQKDIDSGLRIVDDPWSQNPGSFGDDW